MGKDSKWSFLNAEIVFMCVGRDEDIIEVMEGDNGFVFCKGGINNCWSYNSICRNSQNIFCKTSRNEYCFFRCTNSGGQAGAENGVLSIMIVVKKRFWSCKTSFGVLWKSNWLIGPSGSGQIAKMINQICIAGLVQGLSEGMAFGKKQMLIWKKY